MRFLTDTTNRLVCGLRLTGYVDAMSIQPADSVSNVGADDQVLPLDRNLQPAYMRSQSLNQMVGGRV